MLKIPCTLMRAGTSKAAFFLKSDLPNAIEERNIVILKLMGSPDLRQIDGIGGGDPLSSKVAIVSKSDLPDADLNFLFAQVLIDKAEVNTQVNCGNILSGVVPFAIEKGLISPSDSKTIVKIYNENTGVIITATVLTPDGKITYTGNTSIDGVPGQGSPIYLDFSHVIGSTTGKLFPTGNKIDVINNIKLSCLDVAIPVILIPAHSVGKRGNESKHELDQDRELIDLIQDIRCQIISQTGMKHSNVFPKVSLISSPFKKGNINSRYFTPMHCHPAHAVTGAICVAAACKIPGTIAAKFHKHDNQETFIIEHPSGCINLSMQLNIIENFENNITQYNLEKAEFVRTARPLFEGHVYIRETV